MPVGQESIRDHNPKSVLEWAPCDMAPPTHPNGHWGLSSIPCLYASPGVGGRAAWLERDISVAPCSS